MIACGFSDPFFAMYPLALYRRRLDQRQRPCAAQRVSGDKPASFASGLSASDSKPRITALTPFDAPKGNLRAVQILLAHAKIESTVRYLGVDVADALKLAERTEV
jgi:hypothetical protein